jgi:hypothetical protein
MKNLERRLKKLEARRPADDIMVQIEYVDELPKAANEWQRGAPPGSGFPVPTVYLSEADRKL